MATETGLVKMFFFPFTGGGHQIPMIDIARVFASHGAASTIIATPSHALNFQNLITRAQSSGHPITIHTLPAEIRDATDITAGPMKDFEDKGFGTIINSFYELEPDYADYMRNELGKKAWIVGPVSLCNGSVEDKTQRGKLSTIDEQGCLKWLNSKEPHSVIYVCFGSLIRLPPQQLKEIAYGLEASGKSFVWVVGKIMKSSPKNKEEDDEDDVQTWLPEGFEERMKESNRGLILRGWAPQLLILEHGAIGGFVTHCGWNSTLEGVCAGVPMVTWPVTAEQFLNEKLVTSVLRIGVPVGSREWVWFSDEWKEVLGREKVEIAVKKLMGESEEAAEMRMRVKKIAESGTRAVEEGGTSYQDVDALIQELQERKVNNCNGEV
ncbi:hypothetical protein HN51_031528 [Arachis hypogaea]|uniref:Uncharacterized protein n=2 Tax=Arachis TaxID=3817 RepID=A0A445B6V9_ARAHY|nr:abscisate beta-glucosyltransferase-like [Arachis duranensis]XP_025623163.1 abscisate beta-glucosyltransferase-like [Arachis hypogaea]QHO16130.1 Abscisate beta-glucosyltransferase [Arachis hypogaea]RYR34391.1 hypothetical protein Ahy_A10g049229 isoform A [Arachis hypogaea]RYR34392.1 hypothetical protein Ahy_A10g049229 isoform B [Arachis hypogaea]